MPRAWECRSFLVPTAAQLSKAQQEGSCVCQLPLDGARLQPKQVR